MTSVYSPTLPEELQETSTKSKKKGKDTKGDTRRQSNENNYDTLPREMEDRNLMGNGGSGDMPVLQTLSSLSKLPISEERRKRKQAKSKGKPKKSTSKRATTASAGTTKAATTGVEGANGAANEGPAQGVVAPHQPTMYDLAQMPASSSSMRYDPTALAKSRESGSQLLSSATTSDPALSGKFDSGRGGDAKGTAVAQPVSTMYETVDHLIESGSGEVGADESVSSAHDPAHADRSGADEGNTGEVSGAAIYTDVDHVMTEYEKSKTEWRQAVAPGNDDSNYTDVDDAIATFKASPSDATPLTDSNYVDVADAIVTAGAAKDAATNSFASDSDEAPKTTTTTVDEEKAAAHAFWTASLKFRDWNEDYQVLDEVSLRDRASKKYTRENSSLYVEFRDTAEHYGKIIISERALPVQLKTIKPSNKMGGVAGGDKYIHHNILFKFAVDPVIGTNPTRYLYGGTEPNDESAIKAAGYELLGRDRYWAASHSVWPFKLHFPLMCLIDYKGFRLVAMSMMPINNKTLIYGSADGGRTVHASDEAMNEAMQKMGDKLNLKGHLVGRPGAQRNIHGPGDIEGHKGTDGRYYMLDFARGFVPEAPLPRSSAAYDPRGVFYRLLRPEFTHAYAKALCADAFTRWDADPTAARQNQIDVRDATRYLYKQVIPEFAKRVEEEMKEGVELLCDSVGMPWVPTAEADDAGHEDADEDAAEAESAATDETAKTETDEQGGGGGGGGGDDVRSSGASAPRSTSLNESMSSVSTLSTTNGSGGSKSRRGTALGVMHTGRSLIWVRQREHAYRSLMSAIASSRLHKAGVNVRHLGRIRAHCKDECVRTLLLSACVARVIGRQMMARMRNKMDETHMPSDGPFKQIAVDFLNTIFGSLTEDPQGVIARQRCPYQHKAGEVWWTETLRSELAYRFPHALSDEELAPDFDLRKAVYAKAVWSEVVAKVNLQMTEKAGQDILKHDNFHLSIHDVLEIGTKTRLTMMGYSVIGMDHFQDGCILQRAGQTRAAGRLYRDAMVHLNAAVVRAHEGGMARIAIALCLSKLACTKKKQASRAHYWRRAELAWNDAAQVWPIAPTYKLWARALAEVADNRTRTGSKRQAARLMAMSREKLRHATSDSVRSVSGVLAVLFEDMEKRAFPE